MELARRRFWLGLLGLEFILDWEERGPVDRALAGFLFMVQAGEIVLAVQQLFRILRALALRTGRSAAARVIGLTGRRLLGAVALGFLVVDMAMGYARWQEEEARIHRRFLARVRRLREETTCPDAAAIFRAEGVALP